MRSSSMALLAGVLAAGVLGCGQVRDDAPTEPETSTGWARLPGGPLSERENALGLWTGSETLVMGGSHAQPCPPNADCVPPDEPPLRDGAAFDPATGRWHLIAAAPRGFSGAEGVVLDDVAYVWAAGTPGRPGASPAFLSYDIASDRWTELPRSPGDHWRSIAAAGDRLVAFSTSDENGVVTDVAFDPATGDWSALPDDPLPRSYDRTMAWDGRELVLFANRLEASPGSDGPSLALAAALDLDSGEWRRLPDSETLDEYVFNVRWFESDGLLINPAPGESDGGDINSWGRAYPYGGILDPATGEWSDLPQPPPGAASSTGAYGAGIVDPTEAHYFATDGWILDAAAREWIEIPPLDPTGYASGVTVTEAGLDMFVFGGARYEDAGSEGRLSKEAWIWSPPTGPTD